VITGANTGLGFISAREIAKKGHVVVLAVRDTSKGEKAVSEIKDALKNEFPDDDLALDVMRLDLQDLRSIDSFVRAFTEKYDRCDVLMNNAGVMALPERSFTAYGVETQMGTNHMGHFYLTEKMLPSIFNAPGRPRIVNISSVAHEWGHIDFSNYNSEGFLGYAAAGWLTYGRTKLANLYFTYELHRRLRENGGFHGSRVDVNAVHPGIVDTELPRSLSFNFYPQLRELGALITPEEGARGQIELAIGEKFSGVSGKYVAETSGPRGNPFGKKGVHEISESSRWSYDADAAARFWKVSKSMTGAVWETLGETPQVKIH
jgi:NAD(P)-dependent dehydrogenase (short-subunit alcohol dehydrogenase family)